jgi:hypothetical protein
MKKTLAGLIVSCAAFGVLTQSALAAPAQVIIIRHGEKPAAGNNLCPQGVCRADALASVFPKQFGTPAAIYAMAPDSEDGSLRPIETVTPLANALGLTINSGFTRLQFAQVVDAIKNNPSYDGKMVLVSWEHKAIPGLTQEFCAQGAAAGACDAVPGKWSGSVFGQAWILNFTGSQVTSFRIANENITSDMLEGDCPFAGVLPAGTTPAPCSSAADAE